MKWPERSAFSRQSKPPKFRVLLQALKIDGAVVEGPYGLPAIPPKCTQVDCAVPTIATTTRQNWSLSGSPFLQVCLRPPIDRCHR